MKPKSKSTLTPKSSAARRPPAVPRFGSGRRVDPKKVTARIALAALALLVSLFLILPESHAFKPFYQPGCEAYPIALHQDSLDGLVPGDPTGPIREGTGSGNFGWLRWTDDAEAIGMEPNSEAYLTEELRDPQRAATDYREPQHKDVYDTRLNALDWVWGLTGNVNSTGSVRTELDRLQATGEAMRVPVWDVAEGTGSNVVYHIVGFAQVRLDDYDLSGNPKVISVMFLGWDNVACTEAYPDLGIDKSASPAGVRSGGRLTYTLTFSNSGLAPAIGVVISDVLPASLTNLSHTHSGAAITPTAGVTYAWQVQDLAVNQGGTITIMGQLGDGLPVDAVLINTALITGTYLETNTANNSASVVVLNTAAAVYLPLIWK